MNAEPLALPGVMLLKPRIFRDERGHFFEAWRAAEFDGIGIGPFVQDNVSVSRKNVVRGLHLQHPRAQGKLVSVLSGRVFDVAVDVRMGSPTFGQWAGAELSGANGFQLWVPPGFAHGFMALTDGAVFSYKCTDYYTPSVEHTVLWSDPAIGVKWPSVDSAIIAPKDAAAPLLAQMPVGSLPAWGG